MGWRASRGGGEGIYCCFGMGFTGVDGEWIERWDERLFGLGLGFILGV